MISKILLCFCIGKTTTTENMLYLTGATKAIGRVDMGDTITDYLPQERERGITIQSAVISMRWKDCTINLIDTPGHLDFTTEVEGALRVSDGTVVIIDAVSGVQAQTRTVWGQSQNRVIPSIAFINKMDKAGASFEASLESLRSKLNMKACPIQIPIVSQDRFSGIIDLITFRKTALENGQAPVMVALEKEDELYEIAYRARMHLIEVLGENDDSILEKYVEDSDSITAKEIVSSLRKLCIDDSFVPVLCGASLKGKGIYSLLDAIVAFLPTPSERKSENLIFTEISCKESSSRFAEPRKLTFASEELCAFAFKVIHDNARGNVVYARIFSGVLENKSMLFTNISTCHFYL